MKKLFFSVLAILFFQSVISQDIKKVRSAFDKKDWAKAKEAVDLYLAGEKGAGDWEGWYYKGLIYAQVANELGKENLNQQTWQESFDAFKKAHTINVDNVNKFMIINSPLISVYYGLFNIGIQNYLSQNYENALTRFVETDQVGRYIYENKWGLYELDTLLYLYSGDAAAKIANNSKDSIVIKKMELESIKYFKRIADKEISDESYSIVYQYLARYFIINSNKEEFIKYSNLGRKLYPNDAYFDKLNIELEKEKGISVDLFQKYESIIQKDPKDYYIRINYANDMFDWLYTKQKGTEKEQDIVFKSIKDQLNACSQLDPGNTDPLTMLGNSYFNAAVNKQDKFNSIKSSTPTEQKKKADIKIEIEGLLKDAIISYEKALLIFEKYTAEELKKERSIRNDYKQTLYQLSECYKVLGDTKKSEMYLKKEETIK